MPDFSPEALRRAAAAQAEQDAAQEATRPVMAEPPAPKRDPAKPWRWASLLLGGLADAESTRRALKRPGVEEANPVLAGIAHNTPALYATKVGTNVLQALVADMLHKHGDHALANVLAFGSAGVQGAVALRNTQQGKRDDE